MTLIELIVAITLMSVVIVGLATTIGASDKVIQLTRARQVAEAAANKRIEELRDIDYDNLALDTQPTHSSDPNNPDFYVSADGTQYNYTGATPANNEDLIVDTTPPLGQVKHIETPVTVGTTVVDVYQYVTWVDDPTIAGTQNLKRITVVVHYHTVAVPGTDATLRESVLFTPGTVTINPDDSESDPTTTTTSTSTSTTTLPSACGSFSMAGSGGAQVGYTATTTITITLNLDACGVDYVDVSNDGSTWTSNLPYDSTDPTLAWTLTGGDGEKTVSVQAHNGIAGVPFSVGAQNIILDTIKPTTPTNLTGSASCQGSNRTVVMSWDTSTDDNFVGYHVYRSTDGVTWQLVTSVVGTSASDTSSKGLSSTRYYVAAYDKAGNESNASNTILYSKNQCS
jgi:type II secretory pathway pseudopilin PulG